MASQLGAARGRVRSQAKAASSRANGRKGGRPRKKTAASRNPAEADRTRSRFRELRAIGKRSNKPVTARQFGNDLGELENNPLYCITSGYAEETVSKVLL